ncbi:MAG: hypothetical protein QOD00_3160 [Blastocatellia bacterium]|jgi:hypothetical protein|nr:hypothetical protein [Blastocatellia bacterium]
MQGARQKLKGKSSDTYRFIKFGFSLPFALHLLHFYL